MYKDPQTESSVKKCIIYSKNCEKFQVAGKKWCMGVLPGGETGEVSWGQITKGYVLGGGSGPSVWMSWHMVGSPRHSKVFNNDRFWRLTPVAL